jgi:hypothetical protein
MVVVKIPWNPSLVLARQEAAPRARWDKARRCWHMSASEATAFLHAAHARLDFAKLHNRVTVDGDVWLLGFVHGAPKREPDGRPEGGEGFVL